MLESGGIGAGSSPIGCEGFMKASKVQGSSLLLSNVNNFAGYSYIYNYIYILTYIIIIIWSHKIFLVRGHRDVLHSGLAAEIQQLFDWWLRRSIRDDHQDIEVLQLRQRDATGRSSSQAEPKAAET